MKKKTTKSKQKKIVKKSHRSAWLLALLVLCLFIIWELYQHQTQHKPVAPTTIPVATATPTVTPTVAPVPTATAISNPTSTETPTVTPTGTIKPVAVHTPTPTHKAKTCSVSRRHYIDQPTATPTPKWPDWYIKWFQHHPQNDHTTTVD